MNTVASADTSVSRCAPSRANAAFTSMADRLPVPSSIMSAVIAASPSKPSKSAADPTGITSMNVTTGRARCSADHSAQPIRQACSCGLRENRNGGGGPTVGRRDRSRSPLAAHDTTAGVECGSASDSFPFGTTLKATRLSGAQVFRARARCRSAGGDARISRQIAARSIRDRSRNTRIGVELIGLAAEAAQRLQPVDELRFDLRVAALHLVGRRAFCQPASPARRRSPAAAPRACGRAPRWRPPARSRRARASSETPSPRSRCGARRPATCRAARLCRLRRDPTADPSRRRRR